jgi:hypothetical protein
MRTGIWFFPKETDLKVGWKWLLSFRIGTILTLFEKKAPENGSFASGPVFWRDVILAVGKKRKPTLDEFLAVHLA